MAVNGNVKIEMRMSGQVSSLTMSFESSVKTAVIGIYGSDTKWSVPLRSMVGLKLGSFVDIWRTPDGHDVSPRERWEADPPNGCGSCGADEGAYHNSGCRLVSMAAALETSMNMPFRVAFADADDGSQVRAFVPGEGAYVPFTERVADDALAAYLPPPTRTFTERVARPMLAAQMAKRSDARLLRNAERGPVGIFREVARAELLSRAAERARLPDMRDDWDNLEDAEPVGIVPRR